MICPTFVDHLVFRVAELDRTERFYTVLLGHTPHKTEGSLMYKTGDTRLFFTRCDQHISGLQDKEKVGLNHLAFGGEHLGNWKRLRLSWIKAESPTAA
jgi:catechol 2,3-dioxygenase-like lactoylglutathione lyase family enzyme